MREPIRLGRRRRGGCPSADPSRQHPSTSGGVARAGGLGRSRTLVVLSHRQSDRYGSPGAAFARLAAVTGLLCVLLAAPGYAAADLRHEHGKANRHYRASTLSAPAATQATKTGAVMRPAVFGATPARRRNPSALRRVLRRTRGGANMKTVRFAAIAAFALITTGASAQEGFIFCGGADTSGHCSAAPKSSVNPA